LIDFVCLYRNLSVIALAKENVYLFTSGVETAVVDAEIREEDVLL
jgi:hypothetical protein